MLTRRGRLPSTTAALEGTRVGRESRVASGGGADGGEQAQAFFGVAAWVGVVGDEGLRVGAGDEQLLVAQLQLPGLGVAQEAGAGRLVPDVLPAGRTSGYKSTGAGLLRHPEAGKLELRYEKLLIPGTDTQTLVTYHADPASTRRLRLLAAISAPAAGDPGLPGRPECPPEPPSWRVADRVSSAYADTAPFVSIR